MGSIRTESPKPTPSQSDDEAIVELKPPPDYEFSGTVKLYAVAQAKLIEALLARRYTRVTS